MLLPKITKRLLFVTLFAVAFQFTVHSYGQTSVGCENSFCGFNDSTNSGVIRDLKFDWKPAFYFDLDVGKRVINLTRHNLSKATPGSLVLDDYSGGYKLERYNFLEGGVGANAVWWYDNYGDYRRYLAYFVGLVPMVGSQLYTVQMAPTEKDLENLPRRTHAPQKASDLKSWRVGDSMYHSKYGGLIFYAGFDYDGLGPSVSAVAIGSWGVYVEKTGVDLAYVKVTKMDLKSLAIGITGPPRPELIYARVSKFKEADRGFSFTLNLASETGRHAYEDLVRGNIGAIQKLSLTSPDVVYVAANSIQAKGRMFKAFLGLPILLNTSYRTGKIMSFEHKDLIYNKSKVDVNYGVYLRESRNTFFTKHSNRNVSFTGVDYRIKNDKEVKHGYFGQYNVDLGNEMSSSRKLRKIINSMIDRTGYGSQFFVKVPELDDTHLGYTAAHLEVIFPPEQTDKMIASADRMGLKTMSDIGSRYVDEYFAANPEAWSSCSSAQENKVEDCKVQSELATTSTVRSMHRALLRMKAAKGNPAAFVKAYADFGKIVSEDAFALQAATALAGENVEILYRLVGTRISVYELHLATTRIPGQFTTISSPGQDPVPTQAIYP